MKKKQLTKKTLSVFLAVLMLMTSWVFFPGMVTFEAEAALAYGTPAATTADSQTGTLKLTPLGGSTDYVNVKYPQNIYIDKSEDLTSAGYKVYLDGHYGDSNSYRTLIFSTLWGGSYDTDNGVLKNQTMLNTFTNYTYSAAGNNMYSGKENYDVDGGNWVLNFQGASTNFSATVSLEAGVPKVGTGDYHFDADSGGTPLVVRMQQKNWLGNWPDGSGVWLGTGTNYSGDMNIYIHVYDKSSLNSIVSQAATALAKTSQYTYKSLKNLQDAYNNNAGVLTTRNVTQAQVTNAYNAIKSSYDALETRTYDVTYENLFSFSDWYNSLSSSYADSAIVTNVQAGTIKITATASQAEKVTTAKNGSGITSDYYTIPVSAQTSYTFDYTTSGGQASEIFFFWYDAEGNKLSFESKHGSGNGRNVGSITSPANAAKAEIRFDNNNNYTACTMTVSNIAIYETNRENAYEISKWPTRPYRKVYNYNTTSAAAASLDKPARYGYAFDTWTNKDGSAYSASAMTAHKVVYATWTKLPYDVGYNNLFSLAEWSKTDSNSVNDKATGLNVNLENGTIAVTGSSDAYTNYGGGSTFYQIPVTAGEEYIFTYDATSTNGTYQAFVFFYNDAGEGVTSTAQNAPHIGVYDGKPITFTVPGGCTKVGIRVGICGSSEGTATYSKIGIYKKADYDAFAKDYSVIRVPFYYGDTTALTFEPKREGYAFDGWFNANDEQITSVEGLTASTTVYAKWSKLVKVEFKNDDGSVLKTEYVKPGTAATAPQNPTKNPDADYEYVFASWDTDFSNVTADLVVTAQFNTQEHGGIKYNRVSAADCETPGKITKTCTVCNYSWNNGNAFVDESGEYASKLGHNYTEVVAKSSTGVDGVHKVACSHSGCTYGENGGPATIEAAHNFIEDTNHPASSATCTVPGETYYKCACLEEKTIVGAIDPDKHTYDYDVAEPVGDSINHIVYCTSNRDHATVTVACTDADKNCLCDICGQELIHNYVNETKTNLVSEAKCEIDAVYYLTCQCGKYDTAIWTDVGSALKHSFTNYVDQGDATCDKEGTEIANCDRGCGATDSRSTGKKRDHKFDGAVKNNGDGTHSYECSYDDCDVYDTAITCSEWNATEAGCECKVCGYTKDHTYGKWVKNDDNTADAPGKMTRTCDVCGATDTTNCTYSEVKTPATCETDAYTTYTCTDADCGHGYTVIHVNTETGHEFTGAYNYDADTDKHQQACANGCGEYGVGTVKNEWADCSWTYVNKEAGTHIASCVCGNSEEQTCTGGTATCTAKAECQFCNTAYGEMADHNYNGNTYFEGVEKAKDATCTAQAEYYTYCSACNKSSKGTDKEATFAYGELLPHTYTGKTEYLYKATDAECEVNETYYVYCSECKASSQGTAEEDTFEKADTALEHVWINAQHNADTLTHTFTCERGCDKTMTANCADVAVSYDMVPATCTSEGYDIVQCSECGHQWNINYTDALGHDYTKKIYTEDYLKAAANCEHENIYYYACSRCERSAELVTEDEVYTGTGSLTFLNGEIRKHEFHNKVDTKYLATPATCTAAAKYYPSCAYEDCGVADKTKTFSSGSALGHDYTEKLQDEAHLISAADCVSGSKYYYDCSRCEENAKNDANKDEYTYELDDYSGHSMTYTAAKDADCFEAGNYEYWYCSTCKKYYKDSEGDEAYLGQFDTVIKKREHDIEKVAYKAATCEEDGHPAYERCKYDDCNYTTLPAVIPDGYKATGHNFAGALVYDSVQLYHSRLCANGCGVSGMLIDGAQVKYNVTYNEADEAVITGGEKCSFTYTESTKDGVHSHANACVCGNSTTKTYSDEETFVETVAPTCTEDGYDSYVCSDCDATWKKNIVKANGHTPADKATSNGDGTHSIYCTVEGCGYKISTDKCSGGQATCSAKAKCEVCEAEYGETGDHVYAEGSEWVYQDDATCGVNGTEKNTCTVCNTEQEREAEGTALSHTVSEYVNKLPDGVTIEDFDDSQLKAPTCAEQGFEVRYCTRGCGYYQTRTVAKDKNAHIWEADETSEDGLKWTYVSGDCGTGLKYRNDCTVCDQFQEKSVEGSHEWEISAYIPATCTKTGFRELTCGKCGFVEEHYYDAKLHKELGDDYEDKDLAIVPEAHTYKYVGIVEANCTEPAKEVEKCVDCGKLKETTVEGSEAKGHDLVYYKGSDSDCRIEGTLEHWTCKGCKVMYADEAATQVLASVVIPVTPHADNDGNGKCDECNAAVHHDDSSKFCGCICHKESFIMVIIYKIVNFFWKLFKISKSCDCGAVHW